MTNGNRPPEIDFPRLALAAASADSDSKLLLLHLRVHASRTNVAHAFQTSLTVQQARRLVDLIQDHLKELS